MGSEVDIEYGRCNEMSEFVVPILTYRTSAEQDVTPRHAQSPQGCCVISQKRKNRRGRGGEGQYNPEIGRPSLMTKGRPNPS